MILLNVVTESSERQSTITTQVNDGWTQLLHKSMMDERNLKTSVSVSLLPPPPAPQQE